MKCLNRKILKKNVDVDEEIVQKHDIFQKVTDQEQIYNIEDKIIHIQPYQSRAYTG